MSHPLNHKAHKISIVTSSYFLPHTIQFCSGLIVHGLAGILLKQLTRNSARKKQSARLFPSQFTKCQRTVNCKKNKNCRERTFCNMQRVRGSNMFRKYFLIQCAYFLYLDYFEWKFSAALFRMAIKIVIDESRGWNIKICGNFWYGNWILIFFINFDLKF